MASSVSMVGCECGTSLDFFMEHYHFLMGKAYLMGQVSEIEESIGICLC